MLATAQILKSKLERGEDALARDVVDVITAERLDPASLEVAVNAITPPYARLVGAVWDRAQTTIARRAEAEFGDMIADPATLGPRAGEAILVRMYARIAIAAEDGRIVATNDDGRRHDAPSGMDGGRGCRALPHERSRRRTERHAAGRRTDTRRRDGGDAGGTQRTGRRLPEYAGLAAVRIAGIRYGVYRIDRRDRRRQSGAAG